MFAAAWLPKLLSQRYFSRQSAEEARSLELRQQGNGAFKEGRLEEALELYWEAASHNPQDYALFNNISLVALKQGDAHQVGSTAVQTLRIRCLFLV